MRSTISIISAIALGAQTALGTPIQSRTAYDVKEVHQAPRKWNQLGRAPGDHKLHLQIGLKQDNFAELDRHLYEGKKLPPLYKR